MVFPITGVQLTESNLVNRRAVNEAAIPHIDTDMVDLTVVVCIKKYQIAFYQITLGYITSRFGLFSACTRKIHAFTLKYQLCEGRTVGILIPAIPRFRAKSVFEIP